MRLWISVFLIKPNQLLALLTTNNASPGLISNCSLILLGMTNWNLLQILVVQTISMVFCLDCRWLTILSSSWLSTIHRKSLLIDIRIHVCHTFIFRSSLASFGMTICHLLQIVLAQYILSDQQSKQLCLLSFVMRMK